MGFEQCHPAIQFSYFAIVMFGILSFRHPVFLCISFFGVFAYSVKKNGRRAVLFNLALLPLILIFALYYSSYTHFGVTVWKQNFIGNNMTLESFVYGIVRGGSYASLVIWFSCVYAVFSSDKVVYLFGKLSPRLSLFLAILLRMVPRVKGEIKKINLAQSGIGKGIGQGNPLERMRNGLRVFSMTVTWTIDSLTTASESMQSRGSILRGRTAFSIYRFDHRDRAYAIGMFTCMTITFMGRMLGQTEMVYQPRIVMVPVTAMSFFFYAGYGIFCFMPLGLEIWTEHCFRKVRKRLGE